MQSLSPSTPTPAVYLMMAVLPAAAERDIQILRLLGQLAICDRDQQPVSTSLENNLGEEDINFVGWSGLARLCMVYWTPWSCSRTPGPPTGGVSLPKQQ